MRRNEMKVPKDIYLHIAERADDDRTILNMLRVNTKFYSEEFFVRLFSKRYPLLKKFKGEEESWKDFYLNMIQYIYLLREAGVDYIPVPWFNPITIYNMPTDERFFALLRAAGESGNMELAKKYVQKYVEEGDEPGVTDMESLGNYFVAEGAARGGHLDLLIYFLEKGISYQDEDEDDEYYEDEEGYSEKLADLIEHAALGGHFHILEYLVPLYLDEGRSISDVLHNIQNYDVSRNVIRVLESYL